jgi:hypothetical protein
MKGRAKARLFLWYVQYRQKKCRSTDFHKLQNGYNKNDMKGLVYYEDKYTTNFEYTMRIFDKNV